MHGVEGGYVRAENNYLLSTIYDNKYFHAGKKGRANIFNIDVSEEERNDRSRIQFGKVNGL